MTSPVLLLDDDRVGALSALLCAVPLMDTDLAERLRLTMQSPAETLRGLEIELWAVAIEFNTRALDDRLRIDPAHPVERRLMAEARERCATRCREEASVLAATPA